MAQTPHSKDEDPRQLIPKLCRHLHNIGWASGTGGGLSIRKDGKDALHSHSVWANLVTSLDENSSQFVIEKQEMTKGIKIGSTGKCHNYYDKLVVHIIDNTPFERDLERSLAIAVEKYPDTDAVLVRNHGLYVWGPSWQNAKSMAKCYDYLLHLNQSDKCLIRRVYISIYSLF